MDKAISREGRDEGTPSIKMIAAYVGGRSAVDISSTCEHL